MALPSPPPVGSESGAVSNFDDLKVEANYGEWMTTSDSEVGGKSIASIKAVAGGASGSKGTLQVSGEIVPGGAPFNWAGVFFFPGASPSDSANLSGKKTLSFWAKGDGKNYAVAMQTESNQGGMPAIVPFTAGPEWKQYSFPWSAFKTDGSDVKGIAFAAAQQPGKFEFEIDEVEIK